MRLVSALTVLLCSVAALLSCAQLGEARRSRAGQALWRHYVSRHKETWLSADNWCTAAGLGGLLTAANRQRDVARHMRRGLCYWVRPTEIRFGYHSDEASDRCTCLKLSVDSELGLHRASCSHRRYFLCLRGSPVDESHTRTTKSKSGQRTTTAATKTPTATPRVGRTKTKLVKKPESEFADDPYAPEDEHEMPGDETVDHAKFPVIALRPDGHPEGWLPPWGSGTTAKRQPAAGTPRTTAATPPLIEETVDVVQRNASSVNDNTVSNLHALMQDRNSEFITLLVLYTIVGVTLLVLLTLCMVRCCRGYCGKAKIRYVKQVDADDIPRFMPSSWA